MIPFVAILSTIDTVALKAALCALEVFRVERGADRLERGAEARSQLAVVLPAA